MLSIMLDLRLESMVEFEPLISMQIDENFNLTFLECLLDHETNQRVDE